MSRKRKIWLDAGHGGGDPGSVGNGMQEKEINLDVVLRMGRILSTDFEVNYSRTTDIAVSNRPQSANAWGADIFVSVHTNAFNQNSANGTETFIFDNGNERARQSRRLAENLQRAFLANLKTRDRGVKPDGQSQHSGGLGVLRNTTMPAVLHELAFISAAPQFPDVDILRNRRQDMAQALVNGIYNYFGMKQGAASSQELQEAQPAQPTQPTQPLPEQPMSDFTLIAGRPIATIAQMREYIRRINPNAPDLADLYYDEGCIEGIRGDVAFAQSCLETGNFMFSGGTAVTIDQNNFCGMGVVQMGVKGNSYATPQEGIRAQLQHLKAYANDLPLVNQLVTPTVGEARFRFVQRGVAPFVEWLGAQENPQGRGWAMGAGYGEKILRILDAILAVEVADMPEEPVREELIPNKSMPNKPMQKEPMPEEITVDNAIADGIITDRAHWVGVLTGERQAVPEFVKIVFDRAHERLNS